MAGHTSAPSQRPTSTPSEVLVIDGNEEHQMLSALALGRRGFHVTAAISGREGLRLALAKTYDAIILDHKVRDRASFEVLQTLVERLPDVPKIYVVAPGAEEFAVKALQAGATGYLVKTARYNEVLPAEVEDQIQRAATKARLAEQQKALDRGVSERLRVEEALEENEERLRLVLEQAPFLLWTADSSLKITSTLGSGHTPAGLEPTQAVGASLAESFPATDGSAAFLAAHRSALQGQSSRFVQEWTGRTFDVEVRPLRTKGGAVVGVFGVALDVTDRVRSDRLESALYRISEDAASAPTLQDLFRSIHGIVGELLPARNFYIALRDPASDTLTFPYFVDEAEDPPGPQKVGRGLTEYVLRTGQPLLASPEVFEDLVRQGEVVHVGPASVDWLGVPLTSKGRTFGVLAVQSYTEGVRYTEQDRDLLRFVSTQIAIAIERKEAGDALREKDRFLETLISNLPGLAYRCRNDREWTDEFVSDGIQALLGYEPKDLISGKLTWGDLIHPEDREPVWAAVQEALEAKRPYRITYRIRTRQGRFKWVWEQGRGVHAPDGSLLALEGFITDVSPGGGQPMQPRAGAET